MRADRRIGIGGRSRAIGSGGTPIIILVRWPDTASMIGLDQVCRRELRRELTGMTSSSYRKRNQTQACSGCCLVSRARRGSRRVGSAPLGRGHERLNDRGPAALSPAEPERTGLSSTVSGLHVSS